MSNAWVYFRARRSLRRAHTHYRIFMHDAPPAWLWNLKLYYFLLNRPQLALRLYRLRKLEKVGKTEVPV